MTRLLPALALAFATASGTSALDPASLRSDRFNKTASMVQVKAECDDGYDTGYDDLQRYWRRERNSNCDNAWYLDDDADDIKDDRYPDVSDWNDQTYNECARNGVDDAVSDIKKACFEDDGSQCTEIGEAAAAQVVINDWCSPNTRRGDRNSDQPNYREECKNTAVRICKGNISGVVNRWSCAQPSNRELNNLMDECEDQVDRMVGDDDNNGRTPTRRPTRRPTPRPTRPPTRMVTRRPSRREGRCGLNEKCGSCKKASCPDVSERKDCKERYCSLDELALFFPEDLANEE